MRQAAELACGGRGDGERGDAGLLGGHDVHDHGGRVDGAAAGHVQPDALDRHPLLGDRAALHDLGGVVGAALLAVDEAGPPDRLLQRGAHRGVEFLQSLVERRGRDPYRFQRTPSNRSREVDQRRVTAMLHVFADRAHLLQGGLHVELGPGQQVAQGGSLGKGVAAQIDSGQERILQHGLDSPDPGPASFARING